MKQYGYIKTFYDEDGDPITFKADLGLLLLYKSYVGRDFVKDILDFAKSFGKLDLEHLQDLKPEQLQDLKIEDMPLDTTFLINLMAILFINALPAGQRNISIDEAISCIPPYFIADQTVTSELMGLVSQFIGTQKKSLLTTSS